MDVPIGHIPQLADFLQEGNAHVPLVTLEATKGGHLSGVDPRPEVIGAAAVDQVVHQLNYQEYGIPECRTTTLIDGCWLEGNRPITHSS